MTYGGGLWHTWFDRDLTLAGKVIVSESGKLVNKYWHCQDPILKIPTLCIHLSEERGKFEPNKESHTKPIIASHVMDAIFGDQLPEMSEDAYGMEQKHFKTLLARIGADISVDVKDIVDFELNLIDANPACLMGLHKEFVSSPRLDNLASSLTSLDGLIVQSKKTDDSSAINMLMLFDHEEVGS